MKPEDIANTESGPANKPSVLSKSGWGVSSSDPHAGDTISPHDSWTQYDEAILTPLTDSHACEFCNEEVHVAERGVIPADYSIEAVGMGDDGDLHLAYTCHACISDAPVVERSVIDHGVEDVYVLYEDWDSPVKMELADSRNGITHPADRE